MCCRARECKTKKEEAQATSSGDKEEKSNPEPDWKEIKKFWQESCPYPPEYTWEHYHWPLRPQLKVTGHGFDDIFIVDKFRRLLDFAMKRTEGVKEDTDSDETEEFKAMGDPSIPPPDVWFTSSEVTEVAAAVMINMFVELRYDQHMKKFNKPRGSRSFSVRDNRKRATLVEVQTAKNKMRKSLMRGTGKLLTNAEGEGQSMQESKSRRQSVVKSTLEQSDLVTPMSNRHRRWLRQVSNVSDVIAWCS